MTDEQKEAAAAKRRETYARRKQRELDAKEERLRTIEVLKLLRDNERAKPSDRLKAIALLNEIQKH